MEKRSFKGNIKGNGFALIELLVVILIIAILAAVALPQYQKAVKKAQYAHMLAVLHEVVTAQQLFYLEHGEYATKFSQLDISSLPTGTCQDIAWGDTDCVFENKKFTISLPGSYAKGVRISYCKGGKSSCESADGYEYIFTDLIRWNNSLLSPGLYCRESAATRTHCQGDALISSWFRGWYPMP